MFINDSLIHSEFDDTLRHTVDDALEDKLGFFTFQLKNSVHEETKTYHFTFFHTLRFSVLSNRSEAKTAN